MEIILKADVSNLGKALDVVTVKDGYARNFLFPQKLAILATRSAKNMVEKNRAELEARFLKEKESASLLLKKLEEASVTIPVAVGETEQMYGSVTGHQIAESLKKQGFKVEKRQVNLDAPIKQLGVYTVAVKLHAEVEGSVKVWVVKEEE
ncbi:MAG: 50S ribosomal protein L9 [Fibrobacterales bacterium]